MACNVTVTSSASAVVKSFIMKKKGGSSYTFNYTPATISTFGALVDAGSIPTGGRYKYYLSTDQRAGLTGAGTASTIYLGIKSGSEYSHSDAKVVRTTAITAGKTYTV